jgi:hypothetical protein
MADDGALMLVRQRAQALIELEEDGFSYIVT